MARKEITTPLDLKNMNNHNQNYEELYNEIRTTDKRLSENMWEEIKGANTMKMLEPVQTADQLPATAEDKSLITVIEEQRVYGYVNNDWQPFNEIDLDPFEPFKKELAEIVSAYESKIQTITQEVQTTKDSAIDSIEKTQSQSESSIENTKQTAIDSVNSVQQEAESQISDSTEALKGKTAELTDMFNDYLEQLTSNRDTTLVEVENAKQNALDALNAFQSVDTSGWQKHKLTEDDGNIPRIDNADMNDMDSFIETVSQHAYLFNPVNAPTKNNDNGYLILISRSSTYAKAIYSPINDNNVYVNNKRGSSIGWDGWEPLGGTKVVLFDGSLNGVGSVIKLTDDLSKYRALIISGTIPGGTFNELVLTETMGSDVSMQKLNLRNSDGQFLGIYEVNLNVRDNQTLEVTNDVSWDEVGASGSGKGRDAYSFIHVEGWK